MGNDLSKPRIKNKVKITSTAVIPVGTVSQHARPLSTPATPVGIVTQNVQSPVTQDAKSQAVNERNPSYQVTLDSSIYFFDTVRQISEATELLAPLKAVCGVIVKALETTRAVHANKDEWGNLVDEIQTMQDTISGQITRLQKDDKRSHSPLVTDPAVVEPLRRFTMSLGEIFEASSDALKGSNKGSNTVKRTLMVRIDAENIQQYKEAVHNSFDKFMVAINLFTAHHTKEQGDIAAIRALKIVGNPGGNQHQTCTGDTRTELLHDIRTWADDQTSTKQIFWIADRAGTGKSTVAKQIVTEWEKAAKPVVPFFFSITAADTMTNAQFCSTLAVKVASLAGFGSFRSSLAEALKQDLTIETLSFEEQLEHLVAGPLKTTNRSVLVIIDALDECDERGRSELLSALLNRINKIPMIKVMITSRPLVDITDKLQNQPIVYSRDLQGSGNSDSTTEDILRHLDYIFTRSRKLQRLKHHVPRLGKLANGLFIWASTAGKFLERSLDLDAALSAIENMRGLDDLYTRIMECAIPENDADSRKAISFILQAILAAQRPLSISEMQSLLSEPQVAQPVVEVLASVLSSGAEDKPVQILHPTFQEYLTNKDRSGVYFVDVNNGHNSLALGCLRTLSEEVKDLHVPINEGALGSRPIPSRNQLTPPEMSNGNSIPIETAVFVSSTLKYAATYWSSHTATFLTKANVVENEIKTLEEQMLRLFKNYLIQWFELVVLLQIVSQCIKNLTTLERRTPISSSMTTAITSMINERVSWCRDGHRFLQYHQVGIERGSIHVHRALAFTPRQSLTYQFYYNKYAQYIPSVKSGIWSEWPSHQVLSGHTSFVNCVAFSPDGTRIVSGSYDRTLRLWDGVTGASIRSPMKGHTQYVLCVAFSPDGTRVISGSNDGLRLWDGVTGASIGSPLEGHSSHVTCVAFSPDGTRVVSGSYDHTLRLWDGVTGASIGGPMKGHTNNISCAAFSPDGARVISGSYDCTLRLWDGVTGVSIGIPTKGHNGDINCIAISPDGARVVSGSNDFTLRLWDGVTGASFRNSMKGHTDYVACVAFSPDGTRVVSGSLDSTLRLWDGVTGASIGIPLKGHTSKINCVAFSPDGTRIVSGSFDRTLRLWDGVTGASIGIPMKGHNGDIFCVAISPDGARVVSGSNDSTLRLWDGVTDEGAGSPLEGHTNNIDCVAISPDGTRVISGSYDCTLRLWDGVTGASIGSPMKGHTQWVNRVAFSPDGTRVVSGSLDSTVRLWDGVTGASIGNPLKGHTSNINCVAFSADGARIVSGSYDCTLRLWDGVTGASIGNPMEGHTQWVGCVVFSPDRTRVVSGSGDCTLRLWDGMTGASIGNSMKGHTSEPSCVAFSPDGTRIVSSSYDCTLRLWDGVTGASIGSPLEGHTKGVNCVTFSSDGASVVSGSYDSTVRLWDTSSCEQLVAIETGHPIHKVAFSTCGSYVFSEGRMWDVSTSPPSPVTSSVLVSSPSFSSIRLNKTDRSIEIYGSSNPVFALSNYPVTEWVAHKGTIVLGSEDGRVMIVDCAHLL